MKQFVSCRFTVWKITHVSNQSFRMFGWHHWCCQPSRSSGQPLGGSEWKTRLHPLFIFVQFFTYHSGVNRIPADSPTPSALIFLRQTDLPLSEVYALIIALVWPKSAKLIFTWRPQTSCQTMRWVEWCRPIQIRKTTLGKIMQNYVSKTTRL